MMRKREEEISRIIESRSEEEGALVKAEVNKTLCIRRDAGKNFVPNMVLKRKRYEVLEEDEYLERAGKIIRRDFFQVSEQRSLPESDKKEKDANVSLDQFMAKYTSEDNESFSRIQERDRIKLRQKKHWAFNAAKNSSTGEEFLSLQSLTNSSQPLIKNHLLTKDNTSIPKRNLMDKVNEHKTKKRAGNLNHANTRIDSSLINRQSNFDTGSVFSGRTEQTSKNGVPLINGYSFVVPGSEAKKRKEFRIAPMSSRELIARKLTRQHSASVHGRSRNKSMTESERRRDAIRQSARKSVLGNESGSKRPMTPAAHSLLSNLRKSKRK